jgi:DNA-binding IclR family transcriptional regulator|tara:strand:- start:988 stop:1767 length:780 start_codon:yes stop_codon:yes gene_type:complete
MGDKQATAAVKKPSTVVQTILILRLLATMRRPMGVNAIARELGIAPSSCFKILKQLHEESFAEFDPDTKCYTLGGGAALLASRALDPQNIFSQLHSELERFAVAYDVSIGFWRRVADNRIILMGFIETQSLMRIHMSIGQRVPMLVGAVGRAFAAELGLTNEQIESEFAKLRWQRPPSMADFQEDIELCRRRGYAVDRNNFDAGVTTVAVALSDAQDHLRYGISAIRFSANESEPDTHEIGAALVELKQNLVRRWQQQR